mmetsp:Transcript_7258/g.18476  ORF Transcript_7258/g.18476 Transcript_7258/m.18476 type:complete len:379 (+) Transcript_7258:943-2079(+)
MVALYLRPLVTHSNTLVALSQSKPCVRNGCGCAFEPCRYGPLGDRLVLLGHGILGHSHLGNVVLQPIQPPLHVGHCVLEVPPLVVVGVERETAEVSLFLRILALPLPISLVPFLLLGSSSLRLLPPHLEQHVAPLFQCLNHHLLLVQLGARACEQVVLGQLAVIVHFELAPPQRLLPRGHCGVVELLVLNDQVSVALHCGLERRAPRIQVRVRLLQTGKAARVVRGGVVVLVSAIRPGQRWCDPWRRQRREGADLVPIAVDSVRVPAVRQRLRCRRRNGGQAVAVVAAGRTKLICPHLRLVGCLDVRWHRLDRRSLRNLDQRGNVRPMLVRSDACMAGSGSQHDQLLLEHRHVARLLLDRASKLDVRAVLCELGVVGG